MNQCNYEQRKCCDRQRRCLKFYPGAGVAFLDAVASLLKKDRKSLTEHDLTVKAKRFAMRAYKKCQKVEFWTAFWPLPDEGLNA